MSFREKNAWARRTLLIAVSLAVFSPTPPLMTIATSWQVLLAGLVPAELTRFATQLVGYRGAV